MTTTSPSSIMKLLLAIGLAAVCVLLALGSIGLTTAQALTPPLPPAIGARLDRASEPIEPQAAVPQAAPSSAADAASSRPNDAGLPVAQAQWLHEHANVLGTPIPGFDASETVNTGLADNSTVYNGDTITYTIILTNTTGPTITELVLLDYLPDAQLNIQVLNESTILCATNRGACQKGQVATQFPDPIGGTIVVTSTRWITWQLGTMTTGQSARLTISGRVEGQSDGTIFTNRAFADFKLGGNPQDYTFDEISTIARVKVTQGITLSQTPNWFSTDFGGTIGQDWGDYDRDGNLDLVLGSSLGASIYHNVNGRLQKLPGVGSTGPAYGVRWADVNGDGRLELVAVGDSLDLTPSSSGINRVYSSAGNVFSQTGVFTSGYQLVRVVGANFDRNISNTIDLIGSTNYINAPCPVQRFKNDGSGNFTPADCVSTFATAAIAVGDFNNDDYPDLVLGRFPNAVRLLINHNGILTDTNPSATQTNSINFDTSPFLPYDFAWGDYDGDGYLDLAAAFPLQRQVRIYHNEAGNPASPRPFRLAGIISTKRFMTPLAIDWGDFNADGAIDLAVADDPPKVYLNQLQSIGPQSTALVAGREHALGQAWSARAVALDNRNLNLSLSNQNGPSVLYQMIGAHLQPTFEPITGSTPAHGLAWGDADRDGQLDLLLGAGTREVPTKLYTNDHSHFSIDNSRSFFPSGFGPHVTAYGDFNGDGNLEAVIGTGNSRFIDAYVISNTITRIYNAVTPQPVTALALGDMNDDGKLDLLAGMLNGPVYVYRNTNGALETTPAFVTNETGDARSVAWADINSDRYMDFAVANYNGRVRIYRNNRNETFTPIFTASFISKTTSLAWGDFNGDGYPDLAVGTYGQGDIIYENHAGTFSTTPIWTSPYLSNTTSVAWGDWDNDGQLDLAVGHDGQPNQVYANLGSTVGTPRLFALWQSTDAYSTTQIAWGDVNNDGYLELGVSHLNAPSGVYHNTSIGPSHLSDVYTPTLLLPIHPSYVSIARPGKTSDAYLYSSSELLSGVFAPTVTVHYRVFNPNGSRITSGANITGTPITNTAFEYSVNGGTTWKPATPSAAPPAPITQTYRLGADGLFVWDAQKDQVISDNALFRIRVVEQNPIGPVQRASSVAVSPPFRVRGLTCVWPYGPSFTTTPWPAPNQSINFVGTVLQGSGALFYSWNFGDGASSQGQSVNHTFRTRPPYTVTLTVTGPACPLARPVMMTKTFRAIYLPSVRNYKHVTLSAILDQIVSAVQQAMPTRTAPRSGTRVTPAQAAAPTAISFNLNTPIQLTNNLIGYNSQPAIDGDGARVAFWSTGDFATAGPNRNLDGNVELFYAGIDHATGQVTFTQLTSSTGSILGGFNFAPVIDDLGEHIAFFSDRDLTDGQNPRHNFQIFMAHVDANDLFTLTQVTQPSDPNAFGFSAFPSISADGQRIAFVSDQDLDLFGGNSEHNQQIFVVDVDAQGTPIPTTFRQVTHSGQAVLNDQPALDASGDHLAFISDADGNQEIYQADLSALNTTGQITITQLTSTTTDIINEHPRLSSDLFNTITVTYVSGNNVSRTIESEVIDVNGNVTPILVPGSATEQPALNTGDGSRIIAISSDGQQVKFIDNLNLDATSIFSQTDANATTPAISRDGMNVAFVSNRQIYIGDYPIANLAVTKLVDKPVIGQSGSLLYTINVTNSGPVTAPNTMVSDTLPGNLKPLELPGDQTDDTLDATAGFDSSKFHDVAWNAGLNAVNLSSPPHRWEFPNNAPRDGWFDMWQNVLLLHANEANPSTGILDSSGNGNNGACGATCPASVSSGQLNSALSFSGGSTVNINDAASLNFDQNTNFTVMAWVRTTMSGYPQVLFAKHAFPGQGYLVYLVNTGNVVVYLNGMGSVSGGSINDGKWHHVAAVINRNTNNVSLYIDGALIGAGNFSGSVANSDPLIIGNWLNSYPYTGDLDEMAFFQRALTPGEIDMIYNWQSANFYLGYLDSRVMDGFFTTSWNRLNWVTRQPVQKELPNYQGQETGYPAGADMSNNALLLHLNEANSTTFVDTSVITGAHHGTCSSTFCPTSAAGKFNGGQYFNGNNYIALNAPDIPPPWTAEFWVKRQDSPNVSAVLLDGGNTSLRLEQYNGQPNVGITAYGIGDYIFNYTAPIDQWIHLAYVATNNGNVDLYVNGVYVQSLGVGNLLLPLGTLGGRNGGAEGMVGTLDEVAVYSRALTQAELLGHFQRGMMRLKLQVRTCVTSNCIDNTPFIGPNGRSETFYTELVNPTAFTPTLAITTTPNEFFQYRAYFESDLTPADGPLLNSVTIGPPHIKAAPSRGECSGARVITCNLGDMEPNGTATIYLKADVAPNAGGTIDNIAEVKSDAVDHTPNDNRSTATTDVNARVNLSITTSSSIASAVAGANITYTYIVTNSGPNAADNVVISSTLPPSVTLAGLPTANSGGVCDLPPNVRCVWSSASLPPDAHTPLSITFVATIDQNKFGQVDNTASTAAQQTDTDLSNNTITLTTAIRREADLALRKLATPPFIAGQRMTYTLILSNSGPSSANNVRITDTLPAGTTFAAASPVCTGSSTSNIVTCLLAGQLTQLTRITVSVNISPEVRGTITNMATATSDEIDPAPGNENASLGTAISAQVNLNVAKSASPLTPLGAGSLLTYTIDTVNGGPSSALAVTLTDILTRGLQYRSSSPAAPPCTLTPITIGHGSKAYQITRVDCPLGRVDPGQHAGATVVVTVTTQAGPIIANTASITATEATVAATDTITSSTTANATLHIVKSAQPEPAVAGRSITYTLAITNDGPFVAADVVVTDGLPVSITFGNDLGSTPSLSATIDTSAAAGGLISWTIPSLNVGESGQIAFTANANSALANGAVETNRAGIDSTTPHPPAFDTFDSHITTLADLIITKTRSTNPITTSARLTYTLAYSNLGPSNATSVLITDTLPVSLTWGGVVNTNPPLAAPTVAPPTIIWNVGSLAAQAGGTIVFTATVNSAPSGGTIVNTGRIGSPTSDPNAGNNIDVDSGPIAALMQWLVTVIHWLT
jgi:uncharacterized repeat protein (TIGR01451 family)